MPFSWWILGVHLGLSSRSKFMTSSLFTLRWYFCLSTCHMVLHPNSCPGPWSSSLIALIMVVLERKCFLRFKPALLSLLLRVLKLILKPCKLDIMSKITLYEWPTLKYSTQHCRLHEEQNGVNWLKFTPQKGQRIVHTKDKAILTWFEWRNSFYSKIRNRAELLSISLMPVSWSTSVLWPSWNNQRSIAGCTKNKIV